jgi:hypothetical protein
LAAQEFLLEVVGIGDDVGEGEESFPFVEFGARGYAGGVAATSLMEIEDAVVGAQTLPEWSSLLEVEPGIGGATVEDHEIPQRWSGRFAHFEIEGEVAGGCIGIVPGNGEATGDGAPCFCGSFLRAAGVFSRGWRGQSEE